MEAPVLGQHDEVVQLPAGGIALVLHYNSLVYVAKSRPLEPGYCGGAS